MPLSSDSPVIAAEGLTRIYTAGAAAVAGLSDVTLAVAPAELVVLKGDSGSGKSTLLSLLAGLDAPTSGTLTVAGYDLNGAAGRRLTAFRREVVGIVFQTFNLLPTLTVLENVCLPALLAGKPAAGVREKARDLLEWLGMIPRLAHFPAQLSGGEMQRTAIARALINDPAVILADEPTGNLDSDNSAAVVELLAQLNRRDGRTILIATHSDIADGAATRQIRLKDGRMIDPDPPA
jgi:ABC-type lipoprotein export system ATPase subunit